jgi:putative heme-binding domain-containing protein
MGSDPGAGELIYRRIGCVQCHSIGGAGGKLGPDLSSLGASAPLDYIVESVFDPAAKVKEGYHAFAYTMKDGTQFTGIPTRETATEQFIRPGPVPEIPLVKANIVKKDLVGSLMPPGLADALDFTEKRSLFAFLSQIGRPGPFDASKGGILRLWHLYTGAQLEQAEHGEKIEEAPPVYTLIDGRLPREQFTAALQQLPGIAGNTVTLAAQLQIATAGKTRFNLVGVSKAWLDGQPLAVASEPNPIPELSPGVHTLAVQFDVSALPEILRVEADGTSFLGN